MGLKKALVHVLMGKKGMHTFKSFKINLYRYNEYTCYNELKSILRLYTNIKLKTYLASRILQTEHRYNLLKGEIWRNKTFLILHLQ